MSSVGRNEPCPCGSGKKFKHCCLNRAQPATGITPDDRTEALVALSRFSGREEFAMVAQDTALLYAGEDSGEDPAKAFDTILEFDVSLETYFEWVYFDVALEDDSTISHAFLHRHGRSVNPRVADWIRIMQNSHLRLYQVRDVRRGTGLTLRDLWTGNDVEISERAGSEEMVIWDVLAARIVAHADGTNQIEGAAMLLPAGVERYLLKDLRRAFREFSRDDPDAGDTAFFKEVAPPIVHGWWYTTVAKAEQPALTTVEGDPVVFSTLVFNVARAGEAFVQILQEPDFEPAGAFAAAWFEAESEPRRLLARVACDKGTLTVETLSRERAARARNRLEALLGPLSLEREEYREPDPDDVTGDAGNEDLEDALIDPAEVPDLQAYLTEQDRRWLDREVPALDGLTPRQAAARRRMRPRLTQLLMTIENQQARSALFGHGRDIRWIWDELGLDRP
jgi:hypothetical protein